MKQGNQSTSCSSRDRSPRWIVRTIALLTFPLYSLAIASRSHAVLPDTSKIIRVTGISSLNVRRGGQSGPADVGTTLQSRTDTLIVPGSGRSKAHLRFYRQNRDIGLNAEATTRDGLQTLYYFPCRLRVDSVILQWHNQRRRGCDRGFRVQRGGGQRSELPLLPNIQTSLARAKSSLHAQAGGSSFQYYCVVADDSGRSWLKIETNRDPCETAMAECSAKNPRGTCEEIALDRWQTRESELTVTVACANQKTLEATTDGSKLSKQAEQLWQQALSQGLKFCSLGLISATDTLIVPTPQEQVRVQASNTTGSGLSIQILEGSAKVVTASQPEGQTLSKGEALTYTSPSNSPQVTSFDADAVNQTPEVQEFISNAQPESAVAASPTPRSTPSPTGSLGNSGTTPQGTTNTCSLGQNSASGGRYLFGLNNYIDTGISVQRGDIIELRAGGIIRFGPIAGLGGPEGISFGTLFNRFENLPHGRLIARVTQPNQGGFQGWVSIGSGGRIIAPTPGVLELAVNDNYPDNNTGNFCVDVTIIDPN